MYKCNDIRPTRVKIYSYNLNLNTKNEEHSTRVPTISSCLLLLEDSTKDERIEWIGVQTHEARISLGNHFQNAALKACLVWLRFESLAKRSTPAHRSSRRRDPLAPEMEEASQRSGWKATPGVTTRLNRIGYANEEASSQARRTRFIYPPPSERICLLATGDYYYRFIAVFFFFTAASALFCDLRGEISLY